jgi:hypothetical protein
VLRFDRSSPGGNGSSTGCERAYVLDGDVLRAREVHVSAGPAIDVVST